MNLEELSAKEELLQVQLKLIRLEKKKANFVRDQDYEKASKIQEQIVETNTILQNQIQKYRSFLDSNSVLEHTDLLWIVASLEAKYQNLILENELIQKQDHLKESNEYSSINSQNKTQKIEVIRQKNQLIQIFIQAELLLKQWTAYYHFQKEMLSPDEYLQIVKIKHQALGLFPELNAVYCFYGTAHEIYTQVKEKFANRTQVFNPILHVLVQFGSKNSVKLPIDQEEKITDLLQLIFKNSPLYFDGKYKKILADDKFFLYLTIKPDFSPLNIVGAI